MLSRDSWESLKNRLDSSGEKFELFSRDAWTVLQRNCREAWIALQRSLETLRRSLYRKSLLRSLENSQEYLRQLSREVRIVLQNFMDSSTKKLVSSADKLEQLHKEACFFGREARQALQRSFRSSQEWVGWLPREARIALQRCLDCPTKKLKALQISQKIAGRSTKALQREAQKTTEQLKQLYMKARKALRET